MGRFRLSRIPLAAQRFDLGDHARLRQQLSLTLKTG